MKVLVTGAAGFVGRHLVAGLRAAGHEVLGVGRGEPVDEPLDLPDLRRVERLFRDFTPDAVFHLAAIAEVGAADANPSSTFAVNAEGTACLIRTLGNLELPCRFIHVSSSMVYGRVAPDQQPIRETTATTPANAYGWSKLAAEAYVNGLATTLAKPPVILRPFNHVGPGQSARYALSSFARQIAAAERGGAAATLLVGNLKVTRDLLDVRDVVAAYRCVLEDSDLGGTFNVCAGRGYLLANLVQQLVATATVPIRVEIAADRLRPADCDSIVGNSDAIRHATGWQPQVTMEDTLHDLLDDWRQRLAAGEGVESPRC